MCRTTLILVWFGISLESSLTQEVKFRALHGRWAIVWRRRSPFRLAGGSGGLAFLRHGSLKVPMSISLKRALSSSPFDGALCPPATSTLDLSIWWTLRSSCIACHRGGLSRGDLLLIARVAGLLLAADAQAILGYVRSQDNPADRPSRRFPVKKEFMVKRNATLRGLRGQRGSK